MVSFDGHQFLKLSCKFQNYDWGVKGAASLVAQIAHADDPSSISPDKPYCGWECIQQPPSALTLNPHVPLKDILSKDLPFLFKVLSVGKALSIQAHPDAHLAKKLHRDYPDIYRDPNHKPEVAVALTPFSALCGFRPLDEIALFIDTIPEFGALFDDDHIGQLKRALKTKDEIVRKEALANIFSSFIKTDPVIVDNVIARLELRNPSTILENLCLSLNQQFPHEAGCFCVFVLNHIMLQPGESIFLAANEPHAYLSDDCIECMALSDNVVRAGLTPKFRDVKTLCAMLTYKTYKPEELFLKPSPLPGSKKSKLYAPPIAEFAVIKIDLEAGEAKTVKAKSPSILICVSGEDQLKTSVAETIKFGDIYLVNEHSSCELIGIAPKTCFFQALEP